MENIKILTIIVVIVFTSFGCGSNQSSANSTNQLNATNQPSKSNQTEQSPAQEKVIVVTPAQLSKEYKENKTSADAKYLDKILEISGKVESIDRAAYTTVFLAAQPWRIGCVIQESESESAKAGKLTAGQEVTIIGKAAGPEAGTVYIDQCRVK